jgi:hypothetical protein
VQISFFLRLGRALQLRNPELHVFDLDGFGGDVLQIETEIQILSSGTLDVDELRSDAKQCVDELALAEYVPFGQPPKLPFRIKCIASYPSIVRHAPSADWKPRLATMRFLMKRWSCSMMLFK